MLFLRQFPAFPPDTFLPLTHIPYYREEFVVSGILYDRDEYTIEASYVAFGSQEFYDEHVAENDRQYNIYFTLNDSANVSMNNIDSVIKQIAAACGIEEKNVIVNDLYLQWVLQPSYETIAVCGVLILAIVLFSVVVIYNIFQVGIANKIQEYGKIKALGATKKQMKQLIFREGIFLTFFLPFRFPFFCVSAFSKYRVASIGEIRETIFIGLRSAKATVRNDTKIHRSITGRENRGTC
jgi:hypothetical protein